MKILISSIVDLKKSQHNRPHQLVRYLSKKHDVTVLSINDWWKDGQDDLKGHSEELDSYLGSVNYVYLTDRKISPILQEVLSPVKVRQIAKEGFDVHLNYSTLISGYVASLYIRTVYDVADDLVAMIRGSPQIPRILHPFGEALGKRMLSKSIKRSDAVTVTTENLIRPSGIPLNKSQVISNGVDTTLFTYHSSAKEELGYDGFIIGYAGVLREWVDFEPVFSALSGLDPTIRMLIVGKEGRFGETVQLAKDHDVYERVIFAGTVPYSKVPLYISAMDVCIIPFNKSAISESALPLKMFEYMACERPVVTTGLPAIRKIADQYVIYAGNAKEYKDRITELYNDEGMRSRMGVTGRRFVEENYDWERIVGKMERLLLQTASRG